MMPGKRGLIDIDTPMEARIKTSWADSSQNMQLVFSDEFNTDGRSFYPGDDPYWEAVDLHYWVGSKHTGVIFILIETWNRPQTTWSGMIPLLSRLKTVPWLSHFRKS